MLLTRISGILMLEKNYDNIHYIVYLLGVVYVNI